LKRIALIGTAVVLSSLVLAGCGGPKLAAKVNNDSITEETYYKRLQDVTGAELAQQPKTAAGEVMMRALIEESVLNQWGAETKVTPADADIDHFITFSKAFPGRGIAVDPAHMDAVKLEARKNLTYIHVAASTMGVTENDIKSVYDKNPQVVSTPDQYHVRAIVCFTPAKAQAALDALKKGAPFSTVALTQSDLPAVRQKGGDLGKMPDMPGQPNPFVEQVRNLKPNDYTQKVFEVPTGQTVPGAPKSFYVIAQLVEKLPGQKQAYDDCKVYCTLEALKEKNASWPQEFGSKLRDRIKAATITVYIKPYENLPKDMQNPQPAQSAPMAQ